MNKSEFDTRVEEIRNTIIELPQTTEGLRMAEEMEIEIAKAKMLQWALDKIGNRR